VAHRLRLAVIGAGGQVGRALMRAADARHIDVVGVERRSDDPDRRLDLLDHASIRRVISTVRPTHVVLAAAATSVVNCERDPAGTAKVNVDGSLAVAETARRIGARVAFISTDYAFDGEAGPYDERAEPHAINEYGRQKRTVEEVVAQLPDSVIVRTCQVFGMDPRRANYVLWVADQLRAGKRVTAATDLFGTPTFVEDLASSLIELSLGREQGYWHIAGREFISRYTLARLTATAAGAPMDLLDGAPFATIADGVPRPRRAGLVTIREHDPPFPVTPLRTALESLALGHAPQP
jgi:dTDP-4-dehydrorhamnose reductase